MNRFTTTIEKLVYKGSGLARLNDKVVFIPYSVSKDKVTISFVKEKKNHAIGKIESIETSSPYRVPVSCEVFGKCGGCNWLHIDYSYQLEAKSYIIKELYPQIADENFLPIQDSSPNHAYRNKVFYPVTLLGKNLVFGIFAAHSHQVIPHQKCVLIPTIIDEISSTLMDFFKKVNEQPYYEKNHSGNIRHIGFRISQKGEIIVVIVTRKRRLAFTKSLQREITDSFKSVIGIVQNINPSRGNTILGADDKILYGENYFFEHLDDFQFRVHYQSFFQVNIAVAKQMFHFIANQLNSDDIVLDAYCGIGIITILIAKYISKAIGIESNEAAVKDANYNKKINKITNVDFVKGMVEDTFLQLVKKENINTVIFDPPRKGLDTSILKMIEQTNIEKIIYVSCDPLTQKRDIEQLTNFKIIKIKPFDMFPHTFHIENIIVLHRK